MLLSGAAPEIDAETFTRVVDVPLKTEPVVIENLATDMIQDVETIDAETALRSAGFKQEEITAKKKSGFRLF
jgi:stress response protein YsnF